MGRGLLIFLLLFPSIGKAAEFHFNPPGSINGQGLLQEVWSRSGPERNQVANGDPVLKTHECTHFVNHTIAGWAGTNTFGFYVGNGRAHVFTEPRVSVATVRTYVQPQFQDNLFRMYLVNQGNERPWKPLDVIVDEWIAYLNGWQGAVENNCTDQWSELKYAKQFSYYVDCLVAAIKQHDPQYAQLSEFEIFVAQQKQRLAQLEGGGQPQYIPQPSVNLVNFPTQDPQITDIAPPFRQRNRASSCVHASTVMHLRYLGLYEQANYWWKNFRGGESPRPHKEKMDLLGFRYVMTSDGDPQILEWAIANRRGAGVTWGGPHCVCLVGRVNGNAVILDNNRINEYIQQPWNEFLNEWRNCGGWAFVILDGVVPPPTPRI